MGNGGTKLNNAIGIMNYKAPYTCEVSRNWETNETKVTTYFIGDVDESLFDDAIFSIKRLLRIDGGEKAPAPAVPERVIFNCPATIVLWSDNSKTVTKCQEDDEYDPLFGIIGCVIRKLGRNRVKIDMWEWVIEFLADNLMDPDECRFISDVLAVTADAWELKGVDEAMEPYSKWPDLPVEDGDA